MIDADFLLNLPFFNFIMVLVVYALFRPLANGDIKLGRHMHKFILPFSKKMTTSVAFIALVIDCYLIVLMDLIGRISGFRSAVGIYSFNLLCFGIFTSTFFLFLVVYLMYVVVKVQGANIFDKFVYIVFVCIFAAYTVKAFSTIFRIIAKGMQALFG